MPERGLFREIWKAYNRLVESIQALSPNNGRGITITHTNNGWFPSLDENALKDGDVIRWRGEFDPSKGYRKGDVVIVGSQNNSSLSLNLYPANIDTSEAGTYVCLKSFGGGDDVASPIEPNGTSEYWETFARYSTKRFAIRSKDEDDGDPGGNIIFDATSPNGGLEVNCQDCNGKLLKVREVEVCVNGQTMHMMVVASEPY